MKDYSMGKNTLHLMELVMVTEIYTLKYGLYITNKIHCEGIGDGRSLLIPSFISVSKCL